MTIVQPKTFDIRKITKWYKNNTKLYEYEDLNEVSKYLSSFGIGDGNKNIVSVDFSSDYKFTFIDIPNLDKNIKVRYENIFKINLYLIIRRVKKYFPVKKIDDKIWYDLDIIFESSSKIDELLKKGSSTYKHDAYIKIFNDESYFDIGIEYMEREHDRFKDEDKKISSNVILDKYFYYHEKFDDEKEHTAFMKKIIYNIILLICAIKKDEYTLAKIIFFKDHINKNKISEDTEIFNYIMDCHRNNSFNINIFYKKTQLEDYETLEEFIEYLHDEYENIVISQNTNEEYQGDYNLFEKLIINLNKKQSNVVAMLKNIYTMCYKMLLKSNKKIIKITQERNDAMKSNFFKYIQNLFSLHFSGLNKEMVDLLFSSLKDMVKEKYKKNLKIDNYLLTHVKDLYSLYKKNNKVEDIEENKKNLFSRIE